MKVSTAASMNADDAPPPAAATNDNSSSSATASSSDECINEANSTTDDDVVSPSNEPSSDSSNDMDESNTAASTDDAGDDVTMQDTDASSNVSTEPFSSSDNNNEEEEAVEELWDLKTILTPSTLLSHTPPKCSHYPNCTLQACCIWGSNLDKDGNLVNGSSGGGGVGEEWYSCLDCQVGDYGGWPEEEEESGGGLPLKVMTDEHWWLIVERCSEQKVRVCVVYVWFYKWYGESC